MDGWRLRGLANRHLSRVLLWTILLLVAVILVNAVGIRLTGSINGWQQWMKDHAAAFLVWRVLLYAGTVYGWIWLHRRLRDREPGSRTYQRLRRMEVAAVLVVITLEISQLWQAG